jgi:hypothetical protein
MLGYEQMDSEISISSGQAIAGYAIGILAGEFCYPYLPGYVNNASTFNFPVLYKIVEGASTMRIVEGDPTLLDLIVDGGKELEKQGVRAITGACGYFANYQKDAAAMLNVPVYLSSLLQVPIIKRSLKPDQKVGVICAIADALKPELLSQCGIDDPSDILACGCQSSPEFRKLTQNAGSCNSYKLEQQLIGIAKELIKNNDNIGALLLECCDLPAYAWSIQNAVRLPVYDLSTMINWIFAGAVRRPFSGFI